MNVDYVSFLISISNIIYISIFNPPSEVKVDYYRQIYIEYVYSSIAYSLVYTFDNWYEVNLGQKG